MLHESRNEYQKNGFSIEGIHTKLCFIVFCAAIFYSLYTFHIVHNTTAFQEIVNRSKEVIPGWELLGRKKDITNNERITDIEDLIKFIPWMIAHCALTEILRRSKHSTNIPLFHFSFSTVFMFANFSTNNTICFYLQAIAYYTAAKFKRIWMQLIVAVLANMIFSNCYTVERSIYLIYAGYMWNSVRGYIASVDEISKPRGFVNFFAYVFYLPPLLAGPIISYKDYEKSCVPGKTNLVIRIASSSKLLLKLGLYCVIFKAATHFFYIKLICSYTELVETLNNWEMLGLIVALVHRFHMINYLYYGYSTVFATFDGVTMPYLPICASRVHSMSIMWKYFDNGFYKFMRDYIYIPTMRTRSIRQQLISSLLCFTFIFWWHGNNYKSFIWTSGNFVISVTEMVGKYIHKNHLQSISGVQKWNDHLESIACTPLFIVAIANNLIFLTNYEMGLVFIKRLINTDLGSKLTIFFATYTMCVVGVNSRNWEHRL